MSTHKYIKYISKELKKLNDVIDFKIMHGLSYREETRKHKDLFKQINALRKQKTSFSLFNILF